MATVAELQAALDSLSGAMLDGFSQITQVIENETQQVLDLIAASANIPDAMLTQVQAMRQQLLDSVENAKIDIANTVEPNDVPPTT